MESKDKLEAAMTDEDWEDLFLLIDMVTNMKGSWQEKRGVVKHEAQKREYDTSLQEFVDILREEEC